MREIYPNCKKYPEVIILIDDEDSPVVEQYTWTICSSNKTTLYAKAYIKGSKPKKEIFLHRLLVGAKKGELVDHKNRNGLDNRRENLRLATKSTNGGNLKSCTGKSKYKGVYQKNDNPKRNKTWYAQIKINGKKISKGCFFFEKDAALAYNELARHYFGEFAFLNEVE